MRLFIILAGLTLALAHQGDNHPPTKQKPLPVSEEIRSDYQARVKPIFERKCLDCHGGSPTLPWYHAIPGVKQLIDSDLEESQRHLDFSKGYPFVSHATPEEDLQAIIESVNDGTMPPFLFRLGNPSKTLSEDERHVIVNWATEGLKILEPMKQKEER